MTVNELMYMDSRADYEQVQAEILAEYPQAKFDDASDFIHHHRFEVEIGGVELEDFWKFAIKRGFARCGFVFEITLRGSPEKIQGVLDEMEAGER